jgi:hypothetical protein
VEGCVLSVASAELVSIRAKRPQAMVVNRRAAISGALKAHTAPCNLVIGDIRAEF